jgi:elongation factor G
LCNRYLPHPGEIESSDPIITAYGNELCSFAFKTIHDHQLGVLTFLRIFGGELHSGQKVYNATRKTQEKIAKLYVPFADDLKEIRMAGPGQVVIVSGLKVITVGLQYY